MRERLRVFWKGVSDLDTALSWIARLGMVKIVAGVVAAGATAVWGVLDGQAPSTIFVLTLVAAAATLSIIRSFTAWRVAKLAGVVSRQDRGQEGMARPDATPQELRSRHIKGKRVRLFDVLENWIYVRGRIFEDCTIVGPAVLGPAGDAVFDDCQYQVGEGMDDLFIEVEAGRYLIGAIGIENCVFTRCEFRSVSFAGTKESIERWKTTLQLRVLNLPPRLKA